MGFGWVRQVLVGDCPGVAVGVSPIVTLVYGPHTVLNSQKVLFTKSFGESQFPYKSVNLLFTLVIINDNLTDLWGS